MRIFLMPLFLASALCPALHAANPQASSFAPVAVLELFTSEGCSSCPPADALLRTVNLKSDASGQLIIGISEHVTYWNRLGWKDPYSLPVFTDRQEAYTSRFTLESAYTPQMVLNGREQFVGSDRASLDRALQQEAKRSRLDVRIASPSLTVDGINVQIVTHGHVTRPLDVIAVVVDSAAQSNVLRGENAGSLLRHVAVARTLERVGTVREEGHQALQVHIPKDLRASLQGSHHLIVILQEPHQGAIVGSAIVAL